MNRPQLKSAVLFFVVVPALGWSTVLAQDGQPDAAKIDSLVGTWSRQVGSEDTQVKMFNDTHFAWFVYGKEGDVVSSGGGTYGFDGTTLKEKYEYSSYTELRNTEQTFAVESLDNESWRQTGELTGGGWIDETFTRVESARAEAESE